MKKTLSLCLLTLITAQLANAQTNTITGSVRSNKGGPLRDVFVGDVKYKNATFSDSLGNFTIAVYPDSKLQLTLRGYSDTSVNADKNNTELQIVLKTLSGGPGNSVNGKSTLSADSTFERPYNNYLKLPGHEKGKLRGSRYMFESFVNGFFVNSSDELVHKSNYLFDYDKISGAFLLTRDNKTIVEVGWDQVKSFTLFGNTDQQIMFEKAPAIDPSHYVQVLASGKKYKIYKLIKTKFVRSDYVNTGVASHGNDYDEFVDDADYYIVDVQSNQPQKLLLKKKSIKEDFSKEAAKVNKFLADNSGDIDDAYLSNLGSYMNQ